jgi:hypothetical protein
MVMTSSVERKDDVGGALECWVAKSPLKRCWGRHIECLSSAQLDERGGTGRKEGTVQSASDRTYKRHSQISPPRLCSCGLAAMLAHIYIDFVTCVMKLVHEGLL